MSREKILQQIKNNKPTLNPLPELPTFERNPEVLLTSFIAAVQKSEGKIHLMQTEDILDRVVLEYYPEAKRILNKVENCTLGNTELEKVQRLTELHGLDLAILPARIGVAENAAVWLTEKEMGERIVPFIAEHLILVIDRQHIVGDMHAAYRQIEIDEAGFGLFIAGPSKTADIEQSLVIGAQGPRTWLVLIL